MSRKTINNIILIFMILSILGIATLGLFFITEDSSYAAGLEDQTNTTNNSNVLFDVGFEQDGEHNITNHSLVADVNPEYPRIYLNIGLLSGCTLSNAQIQFYDSSNGTDLNWSIGFGTISNEYIASSNDTTKTVNFNTLTSGLSLACNIFPDFPNEINPAKLNETSKAVFTATCTDSSGRISTVYKEINFNVGWTANLTMDLDQFVQTHTKNKNETITVETVVKNMINFTGKTNLLPVKQTKIVVDVPTYQGVAPTSVEVTANKTLATNGEDETNVSFNSSNYNWDSATGKITITVDNPADASGKVAFYRGADEYVIKYTYPKAAYDAFALPVTITSKATGTMTLYSNTSTIDISSAIDETLAINRLMGVEQNATDKKPMYINSLPGTRRYYQAFERTLRLSTENTSNVNSFKLEFTQLKFMINGVETDSYIGGVNYAPISQLRVSKDSFTEFLGSSGYINVYDNNGYLIGTINSSTTLNSNNEYEFDMPDTYQSSAENIVLETSQPQTDLSSIEVSYTRKITQDLPFTLEQIQQMTSAYAHFNLYKATVADPTNFEIDDRSPLVIDEITFADSYTNANINVMTSTLDATNPEPQELELKIVLDDIEDYTDAWYTPTFDVELPSYITGLNTSFEYQFTNQSDGTTQMNIAFNEAKIKVVDGKLHLVFNCTGAQKDIYDNPTSIPLKLKVLVNKYASNLSQEVKLYYINDAAYEYQNPGTWALTTSATGEAEGDHVFADGTACGVATSDINFVTDTNLLCVSEISNYNGTETVNSVNDKDTAAVMGRDGAFPVMTLIAQNNHTVPVSGITLLGRIPYTGNKYAISGGDLGTTIDTVLTSTITQLTSKNNVTIYYSDNLNATKDLDLASNNWTTSPDALSSIKSYLIVIDDTLDVGEQVKFSYEFYVMPGLNYGKELFANFGGYYTADGTTNTSESAKVGLTTGTGPIISAEKTSSIADGATVKEGDIITYTITIRNSGEVDAENVVLTDNIPANTIYVTSDGAGGYIQDASKTTITEDIGTIAAGDSYTYSFSVMVTEITANTTINNTANVSADGIETVPSNPTEISAVTSAPNLTVTKTSSIPDGQTVREGDEITYTIIVRNDGDGIAKNVIIHDAIPKNTTYKDPTTGALDPEKVSISSDPKDVLAPGETYEFSFTVVVDPITENTNIQNAATVTYDGGETETSNTVEIPASTSEAILRVEKTSSIADGATVKEGDLITYTITVYNDGYEAAENITIKDTVPTGTTYYDTTTNTENSSITEISETRATLEPGDSFSISFTVKVGRISTATQIRNTATVTGDNVPDTSSNTVGISADITVPNIRVEKTSSIADGTVVKEGDIITYTITVYNDGDTPAYNVVISDTVPEHTIYYENNTKDPDKTDISHTIPVLAAGANQSFSFQVIVDEIPTNGTIKNTAKVSAENSPEISTNEVGIDSQISVPQLSLQKTSSIPTGTTVKEGDIITYTITVTNTGDCNAHDVIITDNIPEYTTYVEKVGNEYISDNTRKQVTRTIELLEPGDSETLEFSVIVNSLTGNVRISNTATVNANNGEETSSNTVGISAEPKDTTNPGELPYTGNYSIIIILVIAVIALSVFAIFEYRRIRRR